MSLLKESLLLSWICPFFYLCCCFAISTSFVGSNAKLKQYCYIKMLGLYFVIIFFPLLLLLLLLLLLVYYIDFLAQMLDKKKQKDIYIYIWKNFLYAVLRTYFLFLICTWKLNFKFSTKNRKNKKKNLILIALRIKRNLQTCGTKYKKSRIKMECFWKSNLEMTS